MVNYSVKFVPSQEVAATTLTPAMTTTTETQATRLTALRHKSGLSLHQVAEKLSSLLSDKGRSHATIQRYEKDNTIRIKQPILSALAKIYRTTPEYIELGVTDFQKPESSFRMLAPEDLAYIELPFIETAAYGTFGTNCQDFRPEEFSTYSVLKIKGIDYRNAVVMEIKGNSMAPRYPERSRYVIRSVTSGNWQYAQGVHAISLRSAAFIIKRITHNKDGVLTLTSDNGGAEMSVELGEILCMWKVGEAVYMPAED